LRSFRYLCCFDELACLLVKQDTVKNGNRILDTLWEALSG
jgi:hypothetical protein